MPAPYETRRTFAIISHPDAGKTTLTEHLLKASGAIQLAGQVRARGERRRTQSDWMEIEQKRGISVTSSVMTFERGGLTFNLLDTPGHSDFSEDTYRTLTAVDSAVMVIDAARGIEAQTLKLFEICRLRNIPIITFVNKIDREGRDPLEILDEIANTLALDVTPANWPVGMGVGLQCVLDLMSGRVVGPHGEARPETVAELEDKAGTGFEDRDWAHGFEGLELARELSPPFDLELYRAGHLTPVFFGSAIRSLAVPDLLDAVARWAPSPQPQPAEPEPIQPDNTDVTGFVFKVQANMDKNHRDRVAFVRICSGTFRRGMKLHNVKKGKDITVTSPMFFFARERETADEAVAGDVVGFPNHGTLSVGDTLSEGREVEVTGVPDFAPEIIRRVILRDPIKAKQLSKALTDLSEEGVTQVFRPIIGSDWIVGVVGALQLDVLTARVDSEYGVPIITESFGIETARWLHSDEKGEVDRFIAKNRSTIAEDRTGAPVFLVRDRWFLGHMTKEWPKMKFLETRERK
ncbi:MAG: peptide chain release factor 3 [Alphaproteobacteria bacterium]|nr:peptide chain release factor 3 [Alphaproteobacteria bacterium]